MQNSELVRRGVIVPIDAEAVHCVRCNDVSATTGVETAHIDGDGDFEWLWTQGFFTQINRTTGALLDDYEEDEIAAGLAGQVLFVIEQFRSRRDIPPSVRGFLDDFARVCTAALEQGMPIFIVL